MIKMKKVIAVLLVLTLIFSMVSCSLLEDKAVRYVKRNGVEHGSKIYVTFEDYFLETYTTYFIIYDSKADAFSFESYAADRYFEIPPTSNQGVDHYVKINLATGRSDYYSKTDSSTYTGTATIDIGAYGESNKALSNVVINGKYDQVKGIIEQTFENYVYNTVAWINLSLTKSKANVTVRHFGFESYENE